MQKSFQKPKNFQDFEKLCQLLWSEEYKVRLQKNGRNGQSQDGVDIYGIPKEETAYIGIQCKLKLDGKRLTIDEIEKEITNAKKFEPPLKKLIIATTDLKDAKLEASVRKLSILNLNDNLFKIELFCWEEIEDLLLSHRKTRLWYNQSNSMIGNHAIEVGFEKNAKEISIAPKRLQMIEKHVYDPIAFKMQQMLDPITKELLASQNFSMSQRMLLYREEPFGNPTNNPSWCDIKVYVFNNGDQALEDWELSLQVNPTKAIFWEPYYLTSANTRWEHISSHDIYYRDPENRKFVQNIKTFIEFSLRPEIDVDEFEINWIFSAVDFNTSGKLLVKVVPNIVTKEKIILVENHDQIKTERMPIKDFFSAE